MKIAYVFGGRFDPVALGGNAVDIREDRSAMDALGHDVAFRSYEEAPLDVSSSLRAQKRRIPALAWETTRELALLRKDRAWRRRLADDDELESTELVFEYWYPDSFGGAALADRLCVPLVLENLDPLTDERRDASRGLLGGALARLERERRRRADAIFVMSRAMIGYLAERDGLDRARVHWLPQGVNADMFRPPSDETRKATRDRLGLRAEFAIGFVGSMATYQRVDVLVEAMKLLASRRNDVKLVLIGGTPERARAVGAPPDAIVLSHVDYEQVPALVGSLDVAVLPDSNWYGSPVKVLEYAAVGVPVVAPDVSPVRDLVEQDEALLAEPGNAESLAAAIEATLADRVAAQARATRLREKVVAQFDRRTRTRQMLEICTQLRR